MSGSVNRVILIGNLGQDPEVRATKAGGKVVNLSVATSETWKDRNSGERKEQTEWHRCVIFGHGDNDGLAGVAEKYLKKGSKVYLEGQLQTRKWTDQKGVEKYTTEVVLKGFAAQLVLLDGKGEGGNRPPPADDPDQYGKTTTRDGGAPSGGVDTSDDIPF